MQYLRQSTAVDVMLGVFVDDTTGKDTEEALTLAQADLQLSKNCGAAAQKTEATNATHIYGGNYKVPLDATDTGTLGRLDLMCKEAGALPVKANFMVITANAYDSMCSTDKLEVDIAQIGGVTQSLTDFKDLVDTGYDPTNHKVQSDLIYIHGSALTETAGQLAAAFVKLFDVATPLLVASDVMVGTDGANTTVPDAAGIAATPAEVATALTNIHLDHLLAANYDPASKPGVATALLNELVENDGGVSRYTANALEQSPSAGTNPNVLVDTTVAAVTDQTHFTLTAGSNDDDAYKDQAIVIYDASDNDFPSIRVCNAYTGATKTVTLDSAPDFTIVNGDGAKAFVTAPGTTAPTVGQIRTEMEAAGTKLTLVLTDTDELQTNQGNWTTATGFSTHDAAAVKTAIEAAGSKITLIKAQTDLVTAARMGTLTDWIDGGRLDLLIDAIKAKSDNLPSGIAKNVALSAFSFYMVLSSDHVTAATGKTLTGTISKDGGAFTGLTNAIAEISNGMYKVDITQAEMNADAVTLKFVETDCDQRIVVIYTT